MSDALLGAIIGAGSAITVQIVGLIVASVQHKQRIDADRDNRDEEHLAIRKRELDQIRLQAYVSLLGTYDTIIEAVTEFHETGKLTDQGLIDRASLRRDSANIVILSPELGPELTAIGDHITDVKVTRAERVAKEWIAEAQKLRDDLVAAMRRSLSIGNGTEIVMK